MPLRVGTEPDLWPTPMVQPCGRSTWTFGGVYVQGRTAGEAVAKWTEMFGGFRIAEEISGDEGAFQRDHQSANDDWRVSQT